MTLTEPLETLGNYHPQMTDTDNLQWIQDTLNREIRQFILEIARSNGIAGFNYEKYLTPIEVSLLEEERAPRKIPQQHQRCQARINKGGVEEQCSHRSSTEKFCLTHGKSPLKFGLISEPIPVEYQHLFKRDGIESAEATQPNNNGPTPLTNNYLDNYDISLLPLGREYLTPFQFHSATGGCQTVLHDPITKYLYTNDQDNPRYIGQIANGFITR